MSEQNTACPLCESQSTTLYFRDQRDYLQCGHCDLVFVPADQHVTETAEKARYDEHENSIDDEGYCNFLRQLLTPLGERLPEGAKGLDFGSGPGPTLPILMAEQGFDVVCYDKYYAADESLLEKRYDFITSTEVIEHLRDPREVLEKLINMLKPNAHLGIMTSLLPPFEKFANWHYKRDVTHIVFYSDKTFEWIANTWGLELEILQRDVIILKKSELKSV
ncbi:class I SAM-dependent methyltransferase [Leucothrix sargassi]|nr:class I SAM-dependent methyltransferase [Leucothrix sargassi]